MLLSFLMTDAQNIKTERVFLFTDKSCYLAGEDIWLKFSVFDSVLHFSNLSKVGYIEICDTEKPYIQHKLTLENGKGSAKIKIPGTTPSGIYQLFGYTRFMRNEGSNVFFNTQIAIINTLQSSDADRIETDKYSIYPEIDINSQKGYISLSTNKKNYSKRELVQLDFKDVSQEITDWHLSVIRNDSVGFLPSMPTSNWFHSKGNIPFNFSEWLPEYEGHIITGQVIGLNNTNSDLKNLSSSIGVLGDDIKFVQGMHLNNGEALFLFGGIYGQQKIVTSVENEDNLRMDIISPYSESLPTSLPVLKILPSNSHLLDRSVYLQLSELLHHEKINSPDLTDNYYHLSYKASYDLDEYTRFNTMQQTFIEFVTRLSTRTVDGKTRIRVIREEDGRYNSGNTLVLLDGIPIYDHEMIMDYNPHLIKKINIYTGKYIFGGKAYTCMVSFITHRKDLPAFELGNNSQLTIYEFPYLSESFVTTNYSDVKGVSSRKPDLRHTLYWNPFIESSPSNDMPIQFYTSDLEGEFKVEMTGITKDGNIITTTTYFYVE